MYREYQETYQRQQQEEKEQANIRRQEQQNKMFNQQQKNQQHLQQQKQQSAAPFFTSKPQQTATPFASSKPQNSSPFAPTGPGGGVRTSATGSGGGGSSSAPFASSSNRSMPTEVQKPQEVNLFESFDTPSIKTTNTVNKPSVLSSGSTSWYGSKKMPPSEKNDPFGLDDACGADPFAPSGVSDSFSVSTAARTSPQTRPTAGSIFNTSSLAKQTDIFGLSIKDDDSNRSSPVDTRTRSESEAVMHKFRQMYDLPNETPEKEVYI
jgi:hypothetical protein